MNDWYPRMIATLQLNGKGEPTQKAYTRAVRMLSQFYDKTPDLVSEPNCKSTSCIGKTSTTGRPRPCASATAAFAFFTSTSWPAIGTFSRSCAPKTNTACPPS